MQKYKISNLNFFVFQMISLKDGFLLICWRVITFIQSPTDRAPEWKMSDFPPLRLLYSRLEKKRGVDSYCKPIILCAPPTYTNPQKTDTARGEGEPSVRDLWSCGGFSNFWNLTRVSFGSPDVKEGEKVTDSWEKQNADTAGVVPF